MCSDFRPVPGQPVRCQIVKPDGTTSDFECTHTFSEEQVEWFKGGSALNIVRQKVASGEHWFRRHLVAPTATKPRQNVVVPAS